MVFQDRLANFAYKESSPPAPLTLTGTGCEKINWRRIGEAAKDDLANCERDLKAADAAVTEDTVVIPDRPQGGNIDQFATNAREMADQRLKICGKIPAINIRPGEIIFDRWGREIPPYCADPLKLALMALHPEMFATASFTAEPGATYYVKFFPEGNRAKIMPVDSVAGAKEAGHLHQSNDPQFPAIAGQ